MEKTNKKIFIKFDEQIVPKPEGVDYELVPGQVYDMYRNRETDSCYLKEGKPFVFPEHYLLSNDDLHFISKTITAFENTDKMTTGVLLSGLKGSGKTLMAKKIAMESGLPIIVVDGNNYANEVEYYFSQTDTPCCIIFDEVDKHWRTSQLLSFLDGVKPTCKKLVVCTCNKEDDINENLNDRCSRIRYKKIFIGLSKEATRTIVGNYIEDEAIAEKAADFLYDKAEVLSYDNATIFAEEVRNYPNESFDEILTDLNIKRKDAPEPSFLYSDDKRDCKNCEGPSC